MATRPTWRSGLQRTPADMETLLIATTNEDKLREIIPLLADLPLVLVTLADYALIRPPEETGRTFAENARLKAQFYAKMTGLLTVAEDSGLEIAALDGAPGVESARWGGRDATYPDKFSLIYERLRARGVAGSSARFVCAVALAAPEPSFGTRGATRTDRESDALARSWDDRHRRTIRNEGNG